MKRLLPVLPEPRLDLVAPDVDKAALNARENNVSNHLAKLREAGLVRASRHTANARYLYYELDDSGIASARAAIARGARVTTLALFNALNL